MARRLIVFDPTTLLRLMTHYTDGDVPMGAEVLGFYVSPILERYLAIEAHSEEWDADPTEQGVLPKYQFRYEGNRVLSWGNPHTEAEWGAAGETEAPNRQT